LYDHIWVYYNLFQPVQHLSEKQYAQEGGKGKLKCDAGGRDRSRIPHERLKQSGALSVEQQEKLDRLYQQPNSRRLRAEIYKRLSHLWHWYGAGQELSAAQAVA
jgi:hypothetical protein